MIALFIKSYLIGLCIAVPVGPIGVLCRQKTLRYGYKAGIITGLGAALADAIYGCIAAFGIAIIGNFMVEQAFYLQILGCAFLLYLGLKTFLLKTNASSQTNTCNESCLGTFGTSFFLTITNPMTILSFAGIFAAFGLGTANNDTITASTMVTGIFVGSLFWWIILVGLVAIIHKRLNKRYLGYLNKVSGIILLGFGLYILGILTHIF